MKRERIEELVRGAVNLAYMNPHLDDVDEAVYNALLQCAKECFEEAAVVTEDRPEILETRQMCAERIRSLAEEVGK